MYRDVEMVAHKTKCTDGSVQASQANKNFARNSIPTHYAALFPVILMHNLKENVMRI